VIATSWDRKPQVNIRNLEHMLDSLIIQDRRPDGNKFGSTVGAIETLDVDVASGRRLDEICKAVGDTSCSSPINQDVKGI
jgi:hypothetical protein